jgi:PA14 domain
MMSDKRAAAWLFLVFASLYGLTMGGRAYSPDDTARYDMTVSLVERGRLEIPPSPCASSATNEGRIYSKSSLGKSLLMAPFYVAGKAVEGAGAAPGLLTAKMFVTLFDPLAAALVVALLFLVLRALGHSTRAAVLVAAVCGAATMLWPMSKFAFEHPIVAAALLGALLALLRLRDGGRVRHAAVAGACLGFVLIVRASDFAIAAIPFALYFFFAVRPSARDAPRPRVPRVAMVAAFAAPIAAAVVVALAYNYARFDDLFESGYDDIDLGIGNLPNGLFGLLLSPGKSVFLWNLPLVAALLAARSHWARHGAEAALAASIASISILFHGSFVFWHGDWCVGPRYLLPIVPLLLIAIADGLADEAARRRVLCVLAVTVPLAIVVQLIGVSIDYWPYFERFRNDVDGRNFVPARSQLVVYWEYIVKGDFDFFWGRVMTKDAAPVWLKAMIVLPVAGLVLAALRVARTTRAGALDADVVPPPARPVSARVRAATLAAAASLFAALVIVPPILDSASEPIPPSDAEGEGEWTGSLRVREPGRYKFFLRSRDGSWLTIGDSLLIDNGGEHGVRQIANAIDLEAGSHPIRLRSTRSDPARAELRLAWKRRGDILHATIAGDVLVPAPPSGAD